MQLLTLQTGALAMCVVLAGCGGTPPHEGEFWDPHEEQNRSTHEFNKKLDRVFVTAIKPIVLPEPVFDGLANASRNLGLPSKAVNSVLQGRAEPAVENSLRFVINSTIGIGGLFDPAGAVFGLHETDTDFGETLYVWGWSEGAYVVLPVVGASTERDAIGWLVDFVLDPVNVAFEGQDAVAVTGVRIAGKIANRKRFGDTVDSVLHESADSYAQTRLLYLQSRRYQLSGREENDADAYDPYEDPYAE
ncbi:MlaA family lipoprotein [Sedimentimonas flavescens]|uniref:MlaA family lipoprotein n=1 Tax=Sedimentimonas flavescens TaxID=2851012 RepID=UPI0021A7B2D0|nr:VacJ family lipoprotein [Sedimentimonas flavescens]MCT2540886.1 VacJ family lipoprotein [Sedimentimonas flavescens]WBL32895.1 VacJ family lipoprotein [Sinirhodobacter sp. HNIBRBA609]